MGIEIKMPFFPNEPILEKLQTKSAPILPDQINPEDNSADSQNHENPR
jgi:hypothetical protein